MRTILLSGFSLVLLAACVGCAGSPVPSLVAQGKYVEACNEHYYELANAEEGGKALTSLFDWSQLTIHLRAISPEDVIDETKLSELGFVAATGVRPAVELTVSLGDAPTPAPMRVYVAKIGAGKWYEGLTGHETVGDVYVEKKSEPMRRRSKVGRGVLEVLRDSLPGNGRITPDKDALLARASAKRKADQRLRGYFSKEGLRAVLKPGQRVTVRAPTKTTWGESDSVALRVEYLFGSGDQACTTTMRMNIPLGGSEDLSNSLEATFGKSGHRLSELRWLPVTKDPVTSSGGHRFNPWF